MYALFRWSTVQSVKGMWTPTAARHKVTRKALATLFLTINYPDIHELEYETGGNGGCARMYGFALNHMPLHNAELRTCCPRP